MFVRWLIKKLKIYSIVNDLYERELINKFKNSVIGEGAFFYSESKVENFQDNKGAIVIEDNTHIRGELLVWKHGGKIKIGKNCFVGPGTRIWSGSNHGIEIGCNVLISHNVTIIDSDSHEIDAYQRANSFKNLIEMGHPLENFGVLTKPIRIEDYVWISYGVGILKGVTIGKGAIIGAGSIVTKDVEAFSFYAGNPAVFIKKLDNAQKD